MMQAKSWGVLDKLESSITKIHPYNSVPIKVRGTSLCNVTFKNRTVPVEFNILPGSCQPILEGNKVTQLQIISTVKEDTSIFNPVKMIDTDELNSEFALEIQSKLFKRPPF